MMPSIARRGADETGRAVNNSSTRVAASGHASQ
jgi:hypothetical protein